MGRIRIRGAEEHNLKHVSLDVPRGRLTVFTGVSGSGKSSLAFDTIYREGRRRFLESLPAYARRFLGGLERPRVERIDGLSPAIAIEQRTIGYGRRSTVGTVTEILDHFRLLYARLGLPHCASCGRPVRSQSAEQVVDQIFARYRDERVLVCAPVVRARRGEFRRELESLQEKGYTRLRVDGEIVRASPDEPIRLDRRSEHTIEVVYDRQTVREEARVRLTEAVEASFALSPGVVHVVPVGEEPSANDGHLFSRDFSCPDCGVDLPELEPRLFSFNSPHGACHACDGLGVVPRVDAELLIADASRPLGQGGLAVVSPRGRWLHPVLGRGGFEAFGRRHGFSFSSSWGDLDEETRRAAIYGEGDWPGLLSLVESLRNEDDGLFSRLVRDLPCTACGGARLAPMALAVTFRGRSIAELCALAIEDLDEFFESLAFDAGVETAVGEPIRREVTHRLRFLRDVGLSYLSLDRPTATLSGGEAQRIRLASQVGAGLRGVCYVLDEPSIGLHPRDHRRLLDTLYRLRDLGNTVLVVEHDRETIEDAEFLIDLGPGAGTHGGEIVAMGDRAAIEAEPRSLTGQYLAGRRAIERPGALAPPPSRWLELFAVRHNNLRDIDVRIPLERFVVVSGVSGSGKSSLINQVLKPALRRKLGRATAIPGAHRSLTGYQHVDKVIDIDQSPIGRSPRSNPATFTKAFDLIRQLFARLPEAKARGYGAGRFSFNVEGGRCPECRGAGVLVVDMQFLAPVEVVCEACGGRRYNRETLEILYRGQSVRDVLDRTVTEALELFRDQPRIVAILRVLERVGLSYVTLGQPSTTLSGGESQRLKLAGELIKRATGRTLYILDEPTTGLHFEDVRLLVETLHELVSQGNSVLVIEHNLDVIRTADWLIDLGPEGGKEGGLVVAEGPPDVVARTAGSHTGEALAGRGVRKRTRAHGESGERSGGDADAGDEDLGGEDGDLIIEGARTHNLRAVDVRIPRGSMSVITGVSGSGKSSLALDTIFAEGQRRYIDSLSTYARQFLGQLRAPPVDRVRGLSPAIAIDQKSTVRSSRSTVATTTEIHDHLRLLFARIGRPHCPSCGAELAWTTPSRLADRLIADRPDARLHVLAPVSAGGQGPSGPSGEGELRDLLSRLVRQGFTRVFAGGTELRLDEDDLAAVLRRVLGALRGGGDARRSPTDSDPTVPSIRELLGDVSIEEDTEAETEARLFRDPRSEGLLVVIDRLVAREDARSRLADSIEQAFAQGGQTMAVRIEGEPIHFHTRDPSCPWGHFRLDGPLSPRMFSWNSVEGACVTCRGTGLERRLVSDRLFTAPERPFLEALDAGLRRFLADYRPSSLAVLKALVLSLGIERSPPACSLEESIEERLLFGLGDGRVALGLGKGTYEARWPGLVPTLESCVAEGPQWLERHGIAHLFERVACTTCGGRRLKPQYLAVRLGGSGIHEIEELTIARAREFFANLELGPRETTIAVEVLTEIAERLRFLDEVGLGYLALDRSSTTLSGGEAQRIRLASQLGNRLVGVLYVLDEPTVGLHPRDTQRLLRSLEELRDQGNTVILVEHDRETIERSDLVIDMGPGAGREGGQVVARGSPAEITAAPSSLTGKYLRGELRVAPARLPREPDDRWLELVGVTCHNLRDANASFPIGLLTAVTGVSGSGKSTLVLDVLAKLARSALRARGGRRVDVEDGRDGDKGDKSDKGDGSDTAASDDEPYTVREVRGLEELGGVIVVDQKPVGRTPRSTPATFSGAYTAIRELFASLPESRVRGYAPGRFSFNSPEGRCPACEGQGARLVEMQFLSDVWVTCDLCGGARFDESTLAIRFRGYNVSDVLKMTVDEAAALFENQPLIRRPLALLREVGLGYLELGQSAVTLSGGEAQRMKLASELDRRSGGNVLYILDEPTTGLHFDDVRRLLEILDRMVAAGNTVIVIEHNLDVICAADWVIDLGPEAGDAGGRIIAAGPPGAIAAVPGSLTGRALHARAGSLSDT